MGSVYLALPYLGSRGWSTCARKGVVKLITFLTFFYWIRDKKRKIGGNVILCKCIYLAALDVLMIF